jgi:hypothetical protein
MTEHSGLQGPKLCVNLDILEISRVEVVIIVPNRVLRGSVIVIHRIGRVPTWGNHVDFVLHRGSRRAWYGNWLIRHSCLSYYLSFESERLACEVVGGRQ